MYVASLLRAFESDENGKNLARAGKEHLDVSNCGSGTGAQMALHYFIIPAVDGDQDHCFGC